MYKKNECKNVAAFAGGNFASFVGGLEYYT